MTGMLETVLRSILEVVPYPLYTDSYNEKGLKERGEYKIISLVYNW